jgi:hypothetical protein
MRCGVPQPAILVLPPKSEQHISGASPAPRRIAGERKQHPACGHWPRHIDRAAAAGYAVYRLLFPRRIEIPQDLPIFSGIPTQVTVLGAGKYDARDGRHRGRLRWAARPAIAATRRRSLPHALAIVHAKREHAAALVGIEIISSVVAVGLKLQFEANVGQRD